MFVWGSKSKNRREGVHPYLILVTERALAKCKVHDQSVQWRGGVRSDEEQRELFKKKVSKVDGYVKKSKHQIDRRTGYGHAIDIAPVGVDMPSLDAMVRGKMVAHAGFREFAASMFKCWSELKQEKKVKGNLVWGGNWLSFIDLPHWQLEI